MPTVTDWFTPDAEPTRTGVYEVQTANRMQGGTFRYFDGENWYYGGDTPDEAMSMFQQCGKRVGGASMFAWRGRAGWTEEEITVLDSLIADAAITLGRIRP